jgi:CelD/BcsL family acetyltransferase involved in cellulose biosynthesis
MLDRTTTSIDAPVAAARGVGCTYVDLTDVPVAAWRELAARALEPNAFYHPAWARAASLTARGRTNAKALLAFDSRDRSRLIGIVPVVSAWRALKLPVPMLVSWQAPAPLTTPLLDRDRPDEAASGLIDAAAAAGARALFLTNHPAHGKAADAFHRVLQQRDIAPRVLRIHMRARLDATRDAESLLRDALGAKKLKELRRQRNRLSDMGAVTFDIASTPAAVATALKQFHALEAGGWKGRRGTALALHPGDATFIRTATTALAADGLCEIATLSLNGSPIASGILLRHGARAYFFKIAYDESLAQMSPGVQLTLELTHHLCADPAIATVDSIADANHPMIDHVWRERLAIADTLMPTRPDDPLIAPIARLIVAREFARAGARGVLSQIRKVRQKARRS